jgi:hypothetical protein
MTDRLTTPCSTGRYFDIAVRDVAMAIAAFTLARLTEAGVGAESRAHIGMPSIVDNRHNITA